MALSSDTVNNIINFMRRDVKANGDEAYIYVRCMEELKSMLTQPEQTNESENEAE